ncbi:hypothetical protein EB795_08345 [Pseudomonas mandelii]|uniref:hypothetical protein n=1 Tax=Pseudomonas mandelii TaxID=75612 RepID=UPI0012B413D6|nr:hypothetical protein [Pseudomonas mandelii]MSU93943.1 hypothetical protein [Pseudomonas mandelii]
MVFPHHQRPPINTDEAAAFRGKAIRALRGNASVSDRLTRYNRHMATARFLEAKSASGNNLEWPEYPPSASSQDLGGPIWRAPFDTQRMISDSGYASATFGFVSNPLISGPAFSFRHCAIKKRA